VLHPVKRKKKKEKRRRRENEMGPLSFWSVLVIVLSNAWADVSVRSLFL
jgi:hypothetical protein